jgi:hypothetical protein
MSDAVQCDLPGRATSGAAGEGERGEVPERPNGMVVKTADREIRGFEFHPLRQTPEMSASARWVPGAREPCGKRVGEWQGLRHADRAQAAVKRAHSDEAAGHDRPGNDAVIVVVDVSRLARLPGAMIELANEPRSSWSIGPDRVYHGPRDKEV